MVGFLRLVNADSDAAELRNASRQHGVRRVAILICRFTAHSG
jgi:hypothetical protein